MDPDARRPTCLHVLALCGAVVLFALPGRTQRAQLAPRADTTYRGPFAYEATDPAALFDGGDRTLQVTGEFGDDGQLTGAWRITRGDFTRGSEATLSDRRYYLLLDGTEATSAGDYVDGQASGRWTDTRLRIADSRPVDTLLHSEFDYADGVPQRSFRMAGEATELLGRLTRAGLATDTWTALSGDGAEENWHFEQGRLRWVSRSSADSTRRADVFALADTVATATRELDAAYLLLLDAWRDLRGRAPLTPESRAAGLLAAHAALLASNDTLYAKLGVRQRRQLPQVVVPSYPVPAASLAQLEAVSDQLARVDQAASALRADRGLRLAAETDDGTAFLLAAVAALADELVAPVRQLDEVRAFGILDALPLDRYLAALWPAGSIDPVLTVTYDGPQGARTQTYTGPRARSYAVGSEGLSEVAALLDYVLGSLAAIRADLASQLATDDRELLQRAQSTRVERVYAQLDSLVAAQPRRLAREVHLDAVRAVAERELTAYRALDELARQQRLDGLTACMDELYALATTLRNLPERTARIEAAYTDEVWNNIIATVMEERVKKRLTKAYREVLVPDYLERVREELDCGNAGALDAGLNDLHTRMLALREADTEALEERLKDARDPAEVLILLNSQALN